MRISWNWLNELVDIPKGITPQNLADQLSLSGLEVESVESLAEPWRNIVVGQIVSVEKHPNADSLSVCLVALGVASEDGTVPSNVIVTGAKNVFAGAKVPVALPGAHIPDGTKEGSYKTITIASLRGVESRGMLCSEKELGLAAKSDGIWILNDVIPNVVVGTPIATALNRDDNVLTIGVTPNRPDALCHIGIAREVAAINRSKARIPSPVCAERARMVDDVVHVAIEDSDGCLRYACRVIEAVNVGPSPPWLVARLAACGVRSINNVVDVTNLVMLERGLPLHAFDYDQVGRQREKASIVVRSARAGEKFTGLDGKERELSVGDVVISDPNGPIALAGVMGGKNSEVTQGTQQILLEAAYFAPQRVRRTARRLDLHTEASHRFERGCDPNGVVHAIDRAASLIAELTGGRVCRGIFDVYPRKVAPLVIALRPKRAAQILGLPPKSLDESTISKLMLALGLEVEAREAEALRLRIPTFRPDLTREIDIIEELLRLIGYDRVEPTLPSRNGQSAQIFHKGRHDVLRKLRYVMRALSFSEAINLAFLSPPIAKAFHVPNTTPIEIKNPLGEEKSLLRTSLLPGLLQNLALNQRRGSLDVCLYESASVFLGKNPLGATPRIDDKDGPAGNDAWAIERMRFSAVLCGEVGSRSFKGPHHVADFYDAKGAVEELLSALGLPIRLYGERVLFRPADDRYGFLHPRARAEIFWLPPIDGQNHEMAAPPLSLGYVGEISRDVAQLFEIKGNAFVFELDVDALLQSLPGRAHIKELPRYPAVKRDFAFVVDNSVEVERLCDALQHPLVESMEIFDVYQGDKIGAGKKSIALSVTLRAEGRTLKDDEITALSQSMMASAKEKVGAEVRA